VQNVRTSKQYLPKKSTPLFRENLIIAAFFEDMSWPFYRLCRRARNWSSCAYAWRPARSRTTGASDRKLARSLPTSACPTRPALPRPSASVRIWSTGSVASHRPSTTPRFLHRHRHRLPTSYLPPSDLRERMTNG